MVMAQALQKNANPEFTFNSKLSLVDTTKKQ